MSEWLLSAVNLLTYVWEGLCARQLFAIFLRPRWGLPVADLENAVGARRLERIKHSRSGRWFGDHLIVIIWLLTRVSSSKLITGMNSASLIAKLLFHLVVLGAFAFVWYEGSAKCRRYAVVLFLAMHELLFFASYSLLAVGGWILERLPFWLDVQLLGERKFYWIVTAVMDGCLLLMDVMQMAALYLAVNFFRKRSSSEEPLQEGEGLSLCMAPAVAGILISLLLRLLMVTVESDRQTLLYERYHSLYFLVPLISLTLLAAVFLTFHSYRQLGHLYQEQSEKVILQNQVTQLAESITQMEQMQEQVRRVRHDMKNQIAVLRSLIAEGAQQEVQAYFLKMQESVGKLDSRIHTGNPVSDAVINSKFQYARSQMPDIDLDAAGFCLPKLPGVHVYDLGIILSNGLDNAIEACMYQYKIRPHDEVFIALRSFRRGNYYFLEMENSFAWLLRWDASELLTTKTDTQAHGIGLRNIRACARKYQGEIDYDAKGGRFFLSVMLPWSE